MVDHDEGSILCGPNLVNDDFRVCGEVVGGGSFGFLFCGR